MYSHAILRPWSLFAILLAATILPAQEAAKESPIPDSAAQAEAMKLIKEVYGDEYAGAKTPGQKQALAKKLMKKADDTQNDPANKYVILKVAKDVATQAADVETAFAAVDAIAQSFDVNPIEAKAGVLTLVAKNARLPPEHTAVAKQSLALVDPALAKDEFDLAARLGELALAEARLARGPKLVQQIEEQIAQIQEQSRAYEDVKKFASILEQKPTDPEANLAVGKYRCFTKGDWDQGIPMLALGSDEELKALAMKELQGPASSDEQVKLGDGWWKVAEKQTEAVQRPIKGRAGYWYRKAAPLLSGVMKDKVEKRLRETEKESVAPGEPPEPPEAPKATPAIAGLFQVGLQEQKIAQRQDAFLGFSCRQLPVGKRQSDRKVDGRRSPRSRRFLRQILAPAGAATQGERGERLAGRYL